ncbi:hypothetical protein [Allorhodopirellula heiligendammensis]|uniref:Cytochrome c-552/4 domain-containing protein n=1 Tax=Allorhodopirellula heiligendammensis TaxID=2714739 RepID=A0A5C6C7F9_9BACT|nr:hypothetical protein [Allorhodopirellula heiligendammensis]TWU19441.1 hypothetical protein Poly21_16140 [Allorhodopirellula heiligendammensis]
MSLWLVRPLLCTCVLAAVMAENLGAAEARRYASSDSDAGYVHWIDLYDTSNRKITADSTLPYSPQNTCGRCHDEQTISHGWHFNAFALGSTQGRPSEPWIWDDARTGTQLPLSYRSQPETQRSTFDPRDIGLTPWRMASQFGARFPGGGFGTPEQAAGPAPETAENTDDSESPIPQSPRWDFSGNLEIDCMVCHATSGQYDFESRRHHIDDENFAWAPTAAMHLATVEGRVSRIKDDADPEDEKTQAALPKLSYDAERFAPDGTVFFDLVREPDNNACYQCHTTVHVNDDGMEPAWIHDEDVHLRAGMKCVDCHRNGLDHDTVRGFPGEKRADGFSVSTLSCQGCHLGEESSGLASEKITSRAGRLGSPTPLHAGLPPVHFERLSCTACHSGAVPRDEATRIMTSLAHSLGAKERRTGFESPQIQGPIYRKLADGKIYPERIMWPAFWGILEGDAITPLNPDDVFEWTRRPLRVRKSFIEELASDPEKFDEKVGASLAAIETETGAEQAVYVSSGAVYGRLEDEAGNFSLELLPGDFGAAQPVSWPIAHNVRPAGWALGAAGCVECHSDEGKIFTSVVKPLGPAPLDAEPVTMASLQGLDAAQLMRWNQLFAGRSSFKVLVAISLAILFVIMLIGVGSVAGLLTRRLSSEGESKS